MSKYRNYKYLAGQIKRGFQVVVDDRTCSRVEDLPTDLPGYPAPKEKAKPVEKAPPEKPAEQKKPAEEKPVDSKPAAKDEKPAKDLKSIEEKAAK